MPSVANAQGTRSGDGASGIDDTGTFECNENYAMNGAPRIACQNNAGVGEWETPVATCNRESLFSDLYITYRTGVSNITITF